MVIRHQRRERANPTRKSWKIVLTLALNRAGIDMPRLPACTRKTLIAHFPHADDHDGDRVDSTSRSQRGKGAEHEELVRQRIEKGTGARCPLPARKIAVGTASDTPRMHQIVEQCPRGVMDLCDVATANAGPGQEAKQRQRVRGSDDGRRPKDLFVLVHRRLAPTCDRGCDITGTAWRSGPIASVMSTCCNRSHRQLIVHRDYTVDLRRFSLRTADARRVDQDLDQFSNERATATSGDLILHRTCLSETFPCKGVRHLVRKALRVRARFLREGEKTGPVGARSSFEEFQEGVVIFSSGLLRGYPKMNDERNVACGARSRIASIRRRKRSPSLIAPHSSKQCTTHVLQRQIEVRGDRDRRLWQ